MQTYTLEVGEKCAVIWSPDFSKSITSDIVHNADSTITLSNPLPFTSTADARQEAIRRGDLAFDVENA